MNDKNENVILIHGLARTSRSMKKMAHSLREQGYHTINTRYPSTKHTIEILADDVLTTALSECIKERPIHIVTHSLGGILVRQYLSKHSIKNLGRVVMLGPPNQGSEVVNYLHKMPGYKLINGPAGGQLGTDKLSIPKKLGRAGFDLGIIAGSRSINLILSMFLPDKNDGKVSVEKTKLEGMSDHITLAVAHPFLMRNKSAIKQTLYYLEHGQFNRDKKRK